MLSERTRNLKISIQTMMDAGVRKTVFYPTIAESLRTTHGEPRQIRRAKAFSYLLEHVKQEVHPYELLGGSITGMWPLDPDVPDYDTQYRQAVNAVEHYIAHKDDPAEEVGISLRFEVQSTRASSTGRFAMMARDHFNGNIDYNRLQIINQALKDKYAGTGRITPAEIVKVTEDFFNYDYGKAVMDEVDGLPWSAANHVSLNYGKVVHEGYGAILQSVREAAAKTDDPEKLEFYQAVVMSLESAMDFIRRYGRTYLNAAEEEQNPARAQELRNIGQMLEKLATEKAGSFYEAVQAVWITHLIQNIALGSAMSFARFDQYMYDVYMADINAGRITRQEAEDILSCLWLKVNEPKMRTVQSMTLAGITPDGKNAANELTELCLDVTRELKLPYPNVGVRISREHTPEWVYDKSVETIKAGFGIPMLINDDNWIPKLVKLGHPLKLARDYYNQGCVEMMVQYRQGDYLAATGGLVSYAQLLLQLLDDWHDGKETLDTYEQLWAAYLGRLDRRLDYGEQIARRQARLIRENSVDPFASALVEDCIGRGKDMFRGGALCPSHVAINGYGLATTADSLCVIRTLVYEQKLVTLEEIYQAVKKNFDGCEELLHLIDTKTYKFGNDIDEVDEIAQKLLYHLVDKVYSWNDGRDPEYFVTSFFSYTRNVSIGEATAATPNGRRDGAALSDALGPSQGCDVNGPTRMLNSVGKFDTSHLTGAVATNLKINASLFQDKSGTEALKALLKVYLFEGGPQIQVNFVSLEDLKDAQLHPENHRDLVVRIAGFCEYFVNLDLKQQQEIISRTEHEMG